ncbi:hypothetical protein NG799_04790 [Laspinema sp. D1]|uniref:Uncharacterized protein n=1 Tax=Laspinema palackyanum D2a TaxID=2953684 RepID=A0ABT2MLM4_9CYAN|nr:hypothetical protein [Laspinema sp. D2b]MCT7965651.1 hypothetical protein [Laspinema sp. D2a]
MKINRTIYWENLAEIEELQEFFQKDLPFFKQLMEEHIEEVEKFPDKTLDKFSKIRALEVTNGCTQWAFRRGDQECLSMEQTHECMNLVIGFMKRTELFFPSEGQIEFDEEEKAFLQAARLLYQNAFKNNVKDSKREYYAASTAQFIVFGHERMQRAMALVKQDYETLFSPYYIERGQKYIARYLRGFK